MSKEKVESGFNGGQSDAQICEWVVKDLGCAVSLINMIRNDPEMLRAISDVIIARVRAEEENKKLQPELDLNGK